MGAGHPPGLQLHSSCIASCSMPFSIGRSPRAVDGAKDGEGEREKVGGCGVFCESSDMVAGQTSFWRIVELFMRITAILALLMFSLNVTAYASPRRISPTGFGKSYS